MARPKDFGSWLVSQGLLQKQGLRRALEVHESSQNRLDTVLLELDLMAEAPLLEALGSFHATRTVSKVELQSIGPTLARTLSPRVAIRLRVVPFRLEGKTLSVATLDPGDLLIEDELCIVSGYLVATYVALEIRLLEALARIYQLTLPGHVQALISRLESAPRARQEPANGGRKPAPGQADEKPAPRPELHVPHALRRRRAEHVEPLDLSQEDLSLYPSLRARLDGASEPVPATAELRRFDPPAADLRPEDRLAATSLALQNAEMREDIADGVLGHCEPLFQRRLMLMVRKDEILGWRGEGDGVDPERVRSIAIPTAEPSVFLGLLQGADFWLGPLPDMAHNSQLTIALGTAAPSECFVLPIRVREKTVCFLYVDNRERGVSGLPMAELKRLAVKASLAFQVYLMKSKIRNV